MAELKLKQVALEAPTISASTLWSKAALSASCQVALCHDETLRLAFLVAWARYLSHHRHRRRRQLALIDETDDTKLPRVFHLAEKQLLRCFGRHTLLQQKALVFETSLMGNLAALHALCAAGQRQLVQFFLANRDMAWLPTSSKVRDQAIPSRICVTEGPTGMKNNKTIKGYTTRRVFCLLQRDASGRIPLHQAVVHGHLRLTALLMSQSDARLQLHARDNANCTSAHLLLYRMIQRTKRALPNLALVLAATQLLQQSQTHETQSSKYANPEQNELREEEECDGDGYDWFRRAWELLDVMIDQMNAFVVSHHVDVYGNSIEQLDLMLRGDCFDACQTGNLLRIQSLPRLYPTHMTPPGKAVLHELRRTLLHEACEFQQLEIIKYLIHTAGLALDTTDSSGSTALHICARRGFLEGVIALVEEDDDTNYLGHEQLPNEHGQPSVCPRNQRVNAECSKASLANKGAVDVEALMKMQDSNGRTALHWSVRTNNLSVAKYLVSKCILSLQIQDVHGFTPLHLAIESGNIELVRLFIANGADLNINRFSWKPRNLRAKWAPCASVFARKKPKRGTKPRVIQNTLAKSSEVRPSEPHQASGAVDQGFVRNLPIGSPLRASWRVARRLRQFQEAYGGDVANLSFTMLSFTGSGDSYDPFETHSKTKVLSNAAGISEESCCQRFDAVCPECTRSSQNLSVVKRSMLAPLTFAIRCFRTKPMPQPEQSDDRTGGQEANCYLEIICELLANGAHINDAPLGSMSLSPLTEALRFPVPKDRALLKMLLHHGAKRIDPKQLQRFCSRRVNMDLFLDDHDAGGSLAQLEAHAAEEAVWLWLLATSPSIQFDPQSLLETALQSNCFEKATVLMEHGASVTKWGPGRKWQVGDVTRLTFIALYEKVDLVAKSFLQALSQAKWCTSGMASIKKRQNDKMARVCLSFLRKHHDRLFTCDATHEAAKWAFAALRCGLEEAVAFLLQQYPSMDLVADAFCQYASEPLIEAAMLLSLPLTPRALVLCCSRNLTLPCICRVASELRDSHADGLALGQRTHWVRGLGALQWAAFHQRHDVLRILLPYHVTTDFEVLVTKPIADRFAAITATALSVGEVPSYMAFLEAIRMDSIEIIDKLFQRHGELKLTSRLLFVDEANHRNILHAAAKYNAIRVVKAWFMAPPAAQNPSSSPSSRMSPQDRWSRLRQTVLLQLLSEPDRRGFVPFQIARLMGNIDIANVFYRHMDPNGTPEPIVHASIDHYMKEFDWVHSPVPMFGLMRMLLRASEQMIAGDAQKHERLSPFKRPMPSTGRWWLENPMDVGHAIEMDHLPLLVCQFAYGLVVINTWNQLEDMLAFALKRISRANSAHEPPLHVFEWLVTKYEALLRDFPLENSRNMLVGALQSQNGHPWLCMVLLHAGMNPGRLAGDGHGSTLFHQAACGQDGVAIELLELLLSKYQADVGVVDSFGLLPVHYALANGKMANALFLIYRGSRLEAEYEGQGAFYYALHVVASDCQRIVLREFLCQVMRNGFLHCAEANCNCKGFESGTAPKKDSHPNESPSREHGNASAMTAPPLSPPEPLQEPQQQATECGFCGHQRTNHVQVPLPTWYQDQLETYGRDRVARIRDQDVDRLAVMQMASLQPSLALFALKLPWHSNMSLAASSSWRPAQACDRHAISSKALEEAVFQLHWDVPRRKLKTKAPFFKKKQTQNASRGGHLHPPRHHCDPPSSGFQSSQPRPHDADLSFCVRNLTGKTVVISSCDNDIVLACSHATCYCQKAVFCVDPPMWTRKAVTQWLLLAAWHRRREQHDQIFAEQDDASGVLLRMAFQRWQTGPGTSGETSGETVTTSTTTLGRHPVESSSRGCDSRPILFPCEQQESLRRLLSHWRWGATRQAFAKWKQASTCCGHPLPNYSHPATAGLQTHADSVDWQTRHYALAHHEEQLANDLRRHRRDVLRHQQSQLEATTQRQLHQQLLCFPS